MNALNLVANPVVGYRIRPSWYSWDVVQVKLHGPNAKNPGEEYETSALAYCKSLAHAVGYIINQDARVQAEFLPLAEAFAVAEQRALAAVADLERRMTEQFGANMNEIRRAMAGARPVEAPEESAP